ncbi:hypothetical protein Pelo_12978 [Pelomyxa schiedti]|nr:hypothetical protein Pelo_12978 [Pelomyxa schiedti]
MASPLLRPSEGQRPRLKKENFKPAAKNNLVKGNLDLDAAAAPSHKRFRKIISSEEIASHRPATSKHGTRRSSGSISSSTNSNAKSKKITPLRGQDTDLSPEPRVIGSKRQHPGWAAAGNDGGSLLQCCSDEDPDDLLQQEEEEEEDALEVALVSGGYCSPLTKRPMERSRLVCPSSSPKPVAPGPPGPAASRPIESIKVPDANVDLSSLELGHDINRCAEDSIQHMLLLNVYTISNKQFMAIDEHGNQAMVILGAVTHNFVEGSVYLATGLKVTKHRGSETSEVEVEAITNCAPELKSKFAKDRKLGLNGLQYALCTGESLVAVQLKPQRRVDWMVKIVGHTAKSNQYTVLFEDGTKKYIHITNEALQALNKHTRRKCYQLEVGRSPANGPDYVALCDGKTILRLVDQREDRDCPGAQELRLL